MIRPKAPSKYGPYGFLPGYRQPLPLAEWRDRSPRHGGGDFSRDRRYISGSEWRYGWGYPQFYRGRWNAGGFGPCWTQHADRPDVELRDVAGALPVSPVSEPALR